MLGTLGCTPAGGGGRGGGSGSAESPGPDPAPDPDPDKCGQAFLVPCPVGFPCKTDEDCINDFCRVGECSLEHCNDDVRNGDEPYRDCGGSCPVKCDDTRPCKVHADCKSACCSSQLACEADADSDETCDSDDLCNDVVDVHTVPDGCSCLPRFTGELCDQCLPQFAGEHCQECSHRFAGSACDQCASRFAGQDCSQCATPLIFTGELCDQCVHPGYSGADCKTCDSGDCTCFDEIGITQYPGFCTDANCAATGQCSTRGKCVASEDGTKCVTGSGTGSGCVDSAACTYSGKCKEPADGIECYAGSHADCVAAKACADVGWCSAKDECVTPEPSLPSWDCECVAATTAHCGASLACKEEGACQVANGRCHPLTDADCEGSLNCNLKGYCSVYEYADACRAGSHDECAQSQDCKDKGKCWANLDTDSTWYGYCNAEAPE